MIKINNNLIFSNNQRPLIIAEISGNHSGNKKKFLKLIKEAFLNGADLVKIQTYEPSDITINNKKSHHFKIHNGIWKNKYLWDLYKKACTPYSWHKDAFKIAKNFNKILFSSPFSIKAVDFLESFNVKIYKIASFEITDFPLIKRIAKTNKPIILSTGMASQKEIYEAINLIKRSGSSEFALLKCTSSYPADPKNINLKTIIDMRKKFKCEVGLSDHTLGIGVAVASIPFQTTIIEKHFTLNRSNGGVDSKFSIEPNEMVKLIYEVNSAWEAIGKIKYGYSESEKQSLNHRKSIYITKDMKKGEIIKEDNISFLRPCPENGIPPYEVDKIIGKNIKISMQSGQHLKWTDLE